MSFFFFELIFTSSLRIDRLSLSIELTPRFNKFNVWKGTDMSYVVLYSILPKLAFVYRSHLIFCQTNLSPSWLVAVHINLVFNRRQQLKKSSAFILTTLNVRLVLIFSFSFLLQSHLYRIPDECVQAPRAYILEQARWNSVATTSR